jgi:hypothetical protein
LFREFVDQNKDMVFRQGFDVVMRNVEQAVKSVANALDDSLEGLAQKVGYLNLETGILMLILIHRSK